MPLKSKLFSGQKPFEDCLVSDSAHIKPGDKGTHVSSIQAALQFLEQLRISESELASEIYGRTTAAAVLAYKKKRNIINRAYQSAADDIVGKMTIAALDNDMLAVELQLNVMVRPSGAVRHPNPRSDKPTSAGMASVNRSPHHFRAAIGSGMPVRAAAGYGPPLSEFPADLLAVIERTNPLKVPGDLRLYPFIANHLGPQSPQELSACFARLPTDVQVLRDIYDRCKKFDLWKHVNTMRDLFGGDGIRGGLKCRLFDESAAVKDLERLSDSSARRPITISGVVAGGLGLAALCRDTANVHGKRDSWREVVYKPLGSGLHFCVPTPAVRGTNLPDADADIHIDSFQQSQVQAGGWCVPLPGPSTGAHLVSVSPYLVRLAKEKIQKILE